MRHRRAGRTTRVRTRRRGVALLTVLWVVAMGAIIAAGMVLDARDAVGTARNRLALARASWRAAGCSAQLMAGIDERLQLASRRDSVWDELDVAMQAQLTGGDCRVALTPVGLAVDVNAADDAQLRTLFGAAGVAAVLADSMADQILDWRDADDTPRPHGAERAWYAGQHRLPPRDGPIAAPRELVRIGRLASVPGLSALLTTEPGRILVQRAPLTVLRSLPGVSDEVLVRLAVHRTGGTARIAWAQLAPELSPATRVELMTSLLDLERRSTLSPDAWILEVSASEGEPAVTATTELRIAPWGTVARVVRRRSWP
jgi:hypothetical protein